MLTLNETRREIARIKDRFNHIKEWEAVPLKSFILESDLEHLMDLYQEMIDSSVIIPLHKSKMAS